MIHFIKSLLTVFLLALFVVSPSAESALNAYDRQEFTFENALADKNPGFESGVTQWTASGGTFVSNSGTQIVPNSKQFATWDSNSAGQTLQTAAVTVPKTGNCEFTIWLAVPSGTATHTITVTDGTNDLFTPYTITTNVNAQKHRVPFLCPSSGTVRGKLTSVNANEPSLSLDNGRLGSATNVGTSDFETPWESCAFTNSFTGGSNTTLAQCRRNGPNLEAKVSTTFTSVFTGGNATFTLPAAVGCTIDTAKVPNSGSGTPAIGQAELRDIGTDQHAGIVTVSTSSAVLLRALQDDSGPSSTSIVYSAISTTVPFTWANNDIISFEFSVPCVGWVASTTIAPNAQGWFASGEITGANPTLGTSAVTSPTEITNATLTLTPSTGSAPVGIACANGTTSVIGTYTCGVNESLGFITNVPATGVYEVCMAYTISGATGNTVTLQVSKTPAGSSTPDLNGEQRTSFYNSSTTVAVGSTHRNCSNFTLSSGSNTFRLSYEQDAATNAPGIIADGNTSLGQRNFSFSIKSVNSQQQSLIANSVISRDAVNGQVTTVNTIVSPTTTYAATANDETINASTSGGAWTLSLPAAAGLKGKKYHINQTADTANALTIDPNSSETICGQSTIVVRGLRDSITIQSDGTNWIGLDQSCWRMTTARLDCDSASTIQIDRQYSVSSIGNISGGTCAVTMPTGNYSGTPDCGANWNGNGASNDMYAVCSSATSCAAGSIGAATTAQLHFSCRGPR